MNVLDQKQLQEEKGEVGSSGERISPTSSGSLQATRGDDMSDRRFRIMRKSKSIRSSETTLWTHDVSHYIQPKTIQNPRSGAKRYRETPTECAARHFGTDDLPSRMASWDCS